MVKIPANTLEVNKMIIFNTCWLDGSDTDIGIPIKIRVKTLCERGPDTLGAGKGIIFIPVN